MTSERMPGGHVFRVSVELGDFFRALPVAREKVTFLSHFHEIGYGEVAEMNAKAGLSRVDLTDISPASKVKSYKGDRQHDPTRATENSWRLTT